MKFAILTTLLAGFSIAQHVVVPSTCTGNYKSGHDQVLYTTPYTFAQVMSIIGSYKNLTWSGNPPDTVKLNGTNNKIGTARTYNLISPKGPLIIETITIYNKTKDNYYEVHTTAPFSIKEPDGTIIHAYIPYDATTVTPVCGGMATRFNFTADFCADKVSLGQQALHAAHLGDAQTVGKMLGGKNFTSCAAMKKMATGAATPGPAHPSVNMLGASITVALAALIASMLLS